MNQQRIHSIDAVRAIALLGILLVHAHDYFNVYPPAEAVDALDRLLDGLYSHLLVSKAFMVFSFLFGLSFFLQMDHAEARGIDFRGRFCWRLILLLCFGFIHSFFYSGDILVIFSITGFLPVLLWKAQTKTIVALAIFCLLHPIGLMIHVTNNVGAWWDCYRWWASWLHLTPMPDASSASFLQISAWNLTSGIGYCWLYIIFGQRIWDVIGMFMLGLVAGRLRVFEGNPRRLLYVSGCGLGGYVLMQLLLLLPESCFESEIEWWVNTCYVIFFVPFLAWIFSKSCALRFITPLTAIGRCTLTCYITQSIIMMWIICGYGLGWGKETGIAGIMGIAAGLYLVQLLACNLWLRFFRYGPMEGIWRLLTRWGMKKRAPNSFA